jgi:hypothetical protein
MDHMWFNWSNYLLLERIRPAHTRLAKIACWRLLQAEIATHFHCQRGKAVNNYGKKWQLRMCHGND